MAKLLDTQTGDVLLHNGSRYVLSRYNLAGIVATVNGEMVVTSWVTVPLVTLTSAGWQLVPLDTDIAPSSEILVLPDAD